MLRPARPSLSRRAQLAAGCAPGAPGAQLAAGCAPGPPGHARHEISGVLHQPVRLSIAAALAHTESMDFRDLRIAIQVGSVSGKQLPHLEHAGFVKINKAFVGKFPRASVTPTPAGQVAWSQHLDTRRRIAGGQVFPCAPPSHRAGTATRNDHFVGTPQNTAASHAETPWCMGQTLTIRLGSLKNRRSLV
ncbi:transcriptional regulator [Arthrobacter sp. STN4]|uniref:transcriptional regulator n=1 Tax=Arthrobacter sp. STN4 TaxID=2923276 RepID=UPI00277B5962|nr:transcriptional regulator [Arthrobacter sp. STN4]